VVPKVQHDVAVGLLLRCRRCRNVVRMEREHTIEAISRSGQAECGSKGKSKQQ
jgi:hypothetical protein